MTNDLLKQLREEEGLPITGGSGSGTQRCYQVQARMCLGCGPKPVTGAAGSFGELIVTDTRWETLYFPASEIGVPASRHFEEYGRYGFLSYAAAQALRWWFLARQLSTVGLDTRLVEYNFEYSYSAKPLRVVCVVDAEKREDVLPDWGATTAADKV